VSTPGGTDRPAFDPRHDAIYQRGYQAGDSQTAQPGAAPAGTSRAGASRIGDPPAGPGSSGAAAFGGTGAADEIGDLDPMGLDTDVFPDELERVRWNPFIALLWVLGVVLPAGGMTLQWYAVNNMFGTSSYDGTGDAPMSVVLQQFSYLVAPSLISAGLITLAGLLFWHAAAWRARRRISG
jgi:hypothetical protein